MGQTWDGGDVAFDPETWAEVLRVLKPGSHLVAFGGTRTYHRMACAIEDAGFEIRDQLAWCYGSGFPKSQDVAKFIDKALGVQGSFGEPKSAAHASWIDRGTMRGGEGNEGWQRPWMQDAESVGNAARQYIAGSDEAAVFQGWGTALKPAWEPICLARKPLSERTVAANVLRWGTGAINIDGSRVEPTGEGRERKGEASQERRYTENGSTNFAALPGPRGGAPEGRWPANLMHDGSDEVLALFPDSRGQQGDVRGTEPSLPTDRIYGQFKGRVASPARNDPGSAARFFYCAKASKKDRGEGNDHPTVKPTDLMRYLCRLVTPRRGVVLDPFAGSGSTGFGALLCDFDFIGIEKDSGYADIADKRLGALSTELGLDYV